MLERCQRDIELFKYFLKEPEGGNEIVVSDKECSQVSNSKRVSRTLEETRTYYSFQTNDVFVGTEERENDEYDVAIKEIENKLLHGSKMEVQGLQIKIEEGDVFKGIMDE